MAGSGNVHLFDWSGAALRSADVGADVGDMQFTPCGKYLVVRVGVEEPHDNDSDWVSYSTYLHQYDVATMSCVRVMPQCTFSDSVSFAISPCSRVVVVTQRHGVIATRHLYPHNR